MERGWGWTVARRRLSAPISEAIPPLLQQVQDEDSDTDSDYEDDEEDNGSDSTVCYCGFGLHPFRPVIVPLHFLSRAQVKRVHEAEIEYCLLLTTPFVSDKEIVLGNDTGLHLGHAAIPKGEGLHHSTTIENERMREVLEFLGVSGSGRSSWPG